MALESSLLFTTNTITTTVHIIAATVRTTFAAALSPAVATVRAVFTRAILHILPCPRALSGALLGDVLATQLLPVLPLEKVQSKSWAPTLGIRIEPSQTQPRALTRQRSLPLPYLFGSIRH